MQLGSNRILPFTRAVIDRFQNGGKVILPQSIMTTLVDKNLLNSSDPIQFRIHSIKSKILCLCGILDYHNKGDDIIFIPDWMQEYMNAS